MAEHGKLESAQDAGGGRLVDVTPLSELGQAVKAPPVEPAHVKTAETTDAATASTSTTVAGPQPKTSAAGIPPGGPAGVDEDEYTSESTEEVPALRGEPLIKGVRLFGIRGGQPLQLGYGYWPLFSVETEIWPCCSHPLVWPWPWPNGAVELAAVIG